jgi:FtsP/CotA-like multicopper oxidase with cupredoxin domain
VTLTAIFGVTTAAAQTSIVKPVNKSNLVVQHQRIDSQQPANPVTNTPKKGTLGSVSATTPAPQRMRGTTNAQRTAAAARMAARRSAEAKTPLGKARANAIVGIPGATRPLTLDQLYFSGTFPNYANSPLPNLNDTVNCQAPNFCGMRKFVDTLPLLNSPNNLGNQLPVAVPDTTTFPGSDYYEIALVQFNQRLHSDLPAGGTLIRGYVQVNAPAGSSSLIPSYLGPIIVAQANRPVRLKFTNKLPTGAAGNLQIPTDLTALGAGLGMAKGQSPYLQNRATIHLHGGNTPWISDGTPHQWTIPAGDWLNTKYQRGDSVSFVPDMFFRTDGSVVPQCSATVISQCSDTPGMVGELNLPAGATNDPGPGSLTFYYTNQQSGRLLFYHDHAYGTTRLNVYVGEASGYLITDQIDTDLTTGTNVSGVFTKANIPMQALVPAAQIPLVIQDKSFVPQNFASTTVYSVPVLSGGEGYTTASVSFAGGCTTLPTATANIADGVDDFGQLIYGTITDITLTSAGSGCTSDPIVTITGDGSGATAFASIATLSQEDPTWDTSLWGSYGNFWYPHVYMPNQWPGNPDASNTNPMGRWDYASWFWPPFNNTSGLFTVRGDTPCPTAYDPTMVCPGFPTALLPAPATEVNGTVHLGQGSTVSLVPEGFMDTPLINGSAYPVLTVDPKPYRFRILSVANERTFNLSWFLACDSSAPTANGNGYTPTTGASCPAPTVPGVPNLTEVGMVPAVTTAGFPAWWPIDGRIGGVPDPAAKGPSWIQIGTEGGVLPNVAVIPPAPIAYETGMRSVTVTNMSSHGLLLMSAERADAIVDFSAYAGRTLILYNDAPAPAPAHDDRYDYYTGDPDFSGSGGAPTTLVGFGPNTRTIMQVKVNAGTPAPFTAAQLTALKAAIPAAFNIAQPPPVVPESTYNAAYPQTGQPLKDVFPALQSTQLTFVPIDPSTKQLSKVVTNIPTVGGTAVTLPLHMKTIQELFELDYGRMNATLGTELPLTNFNTQTTIPLGYIDPYTEDVYDSSNVQASPVGIGPDGSQIWMVIHNGVDSHAIHFHLFDVQLIDRFGWDGTMRIPFPDELGWKDTVRMNPLEIDFVALRAMRQTLPFPVPDSARLFDVTKPAGTDLTMSAFDPFNNAAPQINQVQPMGWEYVWHCHLLGHEENDMMRASVFQVAPETPANLAVHTVRISGSNRNQVTFRDMSLSEAGFTIQRSTSASFPTGTATRSFNVAGAKAGWGSTVTYNDTVSGNTYYYRVRSYKLDADYWTPQIGPLVGANTGIPSNLPNIVSQWTGVANATAAPIIGLSSANLSYAAAAYLSTSAAQTITVSSLGVVNLVLNVPAITGPNAGDFAIIANTCPVGILAPGATCTISITFKPTYAGTRTASLSIPSNDPSNGGIATAGLTGIGNLIPLTITAPTSTVPWSPTLNPASILNATLSITPPDPLASFGITCSASGYTAPGGPAGSYTTSCSAATNPGGAYSLSFVTGRLTVSKVAAAMISPTSGSVLGYPSQAFTWTTGGAAQTYTLWVSAVAVGGRELYAGTTTATTATVNTMPTAGQTIYVRLYTAVNGVNQFIDYTYSAHPGTPAALTSPLTGPLPASVLFQWSAGQGVTNYGLRVSTVAPGGTDVYLSGYLTGTQQQVNNIPQGKKIYVRLTSLINGVWQVADYTF